VRAIRLPLLLVLLAAGIWYLPRIRSLAEERTRAFLVDPIHVEVATAPAWFEGGVEASLRAALESIAPAPLRSDDEVTALARALSHASGWIRVIHRVEKRYPNRLEVEFELRQPVAMLESDAGLVLADAEDVVVAPAAEAVRYLELHELPLVHGPRVLSGVAVGERVRDLSLLEGLRIAEELRPHRSSLAARNLHLDVIDVSVQERAGGRALSDVDLYTRDGLAIEWGRSSGNPRLGALEPPTEAKVRGLLRVAARHPDLAGIRRIRLQFTEPYLVFEDDAPAVAVGPSLPRPP
jgi:hypothetical protein